MKGDGIILGPFDETSRPDGKGGVKGNIGRKTKYALDDVPDVADAPFLCPRRTEMRDVISFLDRLIAGFAR